MALVSASALRRLTAVCGLKVGVGGFLLRFLQSFWRASQVSFGLPRCAGGLDIMFHFPA